MRPFNQKALPQQEGVLQNNQNTYPMIQREQSYIQPNRGSSRINPKVGLAPTDYDPDNIGLSPEDAYRYYGNSLPEGIRNQIRSRIEGNQLQGKEIQNPNMGGMLNAPNQNLSSSQQNISSNSNQNNMSLIPYMLPDSNMENSMEDQKNMDVIENPNVENPNVLKNPIQIGVNSEGRSISMGGGGNQLPYDETGAFNRMWPDLESGNRRLEEMGQGNSFPNGPQNPYFNPMNQQYNPEIPESTFPWGKATAIGGGVALGASLLGYLLSDKNKKKTGKER